MDRQSDPLLIGIKKDVAIERQGAFYMTLAPSKIILLFIACTGLILQPVSMFCGEQNIEYEEQNDRPEETILQDEDGEEIIDDIIDDNSNASNQVATNNVTGRKIRSIFIEGNKQISSQAILYRLPYKSGEIYDPAKTRSLIKRLYKDLKRLRHIAVYGEPVGSDMIDLYVVVQEKKLLKDFRLVNNTQVSTKEILEKTKLDQIPAIDYEELKVISSKIRHLYSEKGYHSVDINARLEIDSDDKAVLVFEFTEYPKSLVKKIKFIGNEAFPGKKLRSTLYSREDWILSFMDGSGIYQKERTEADKQVIEQLYQNHGYIGAKVTDVTVETDECSQDITLTYYIEEGAQYCVGTVTVVDADGLSGAKIAECLPLQPGDIYSRENVVESIKFIEHIWNDRGYLYANVEPRMNPDDVNKTVDVTFDHDLGDKVFLRNLTIVGNNKTRDKIIRRQLLVEEGGLLTESAMEASKNRVESLGYFELKDGVTWKMTRVNQNLADLDLILKEAKTGNASFQLGFNGTASINSPADGLAMDFNVADSNLGGWGVSVNLNGRLAKNEKTFIANITQPWLFDKPIMSAVDVYHKRLGYDDFKATTAVNELRTGGSLTTGFMTILPRFNFTDVFVRSNLGFDSITYQGVPNDITRMPDQVGLFNNADATIQYRRLLNEEFTPGHLTWLTFTVGQEKKNHPMHPSKGYAWVARSYTGIPNPASPLAFEKIDLDFHWYTPLIGDRDLIFHWHNYFGYIVPLTNKIIPFGELFHIGGPASVRGYLFGQLSPRFNVNGASDSIGASRTLFVNAELIFPIQPDMTIKGVLFYDGGSGWNTPYRTPANQQFIINNNFDYRHAIGAGIRLLNPMPIKIDVGFKLDPRPGESPYEVHFGMNYDW